MNQRQNNSWTKDKAYIVLLPKFQGAEQIGDFRPISLSNYLYLIFAKVLANRLRGCFHLWLARFSLHLSRAGRWQTTLCWQKRSSQHGIGMAPPVSCGRWILPRPMTLLTGVFSGMSSDVGASQRHGCVGWNSVLLPPLSPSWWTVGRKGDGFTLNEAFGRAARWPPYCSS